MQVIPEGGDRPVLHPTGQGKEEAQPAVQEQQEERQPARALPPAQLVGQQAVAGVGQQHHQRAGEGHGRIQRHPEQVERGRHRVRQIGIGHGGPKHQAVFQRELGVDDAGADGQMQAQVAIGALAHVIGAVGGQPDGVGVLQIAADCAQRKHHQGQRQQQLFLLVVHRRRGGPVPENPAHSAQGRKGACRQSVGRIGKPYRVGPQHRQPHHQEKAQTQAQIHPQHGLAAGQQHSCQEYAPRQKEQQIQNSQHFRRALQEWIRVREE